MTSAYILAECFSAAPYAFGDFFQECQREPNAFRFLHVFEGMLPENPWCVEIAGPADKCCDRDISLLFFEFRLHNFSSSPHFFVRSSRNINCVHCGIPWWFHRTCNCSCTFSKVVDTTSKPHHDRSGCGSGENHVSRPELARAASSYDPARAARWLSYDWMPVTARAARWLRSKSHPAREGPLKGFFFRLKRQSSQQHAHGEFCIAVSQKLRSGSDWPLWCR